MHARARFSSQNNRPQLVRCTHPYIGAHTPRSSRRDKPTTVVWTECFGRNDLGERHASTTDLVSRKRKTRFVRPTVGTLPSRLLGQSLRIRETVSAGRVYFDLTSLGQSSASRDRISLARIPPRPLSRLRKTYVRAASAAAHHAQFNPALAGDDEPELCRCRTPAQFAPRVASTPRPAAARLWPVQSGGPMTG